jgi:hypothetical protein
MQIPLLTGIFTDNQADFRANYPRNMIPIALDQGISTGYLRPADGIIQNGTGPGINRGGISGRESYTASWARSSCLWHRMAQSPR